MTLGSRLLKLHPRGTLMKRDARCPAKWWDMGKKNRTNKIGTFQLEARFNYSLGSVFNNRITDYFTSANPMNLSVNFAYLWEIKIK